MKSLLHLLTTALVCTAAVPAALDERAINPNETPWKLSDIGSDQRVWKQEVTRDTPEGSFTDTRSFTELASGLYYSRDGLRGETTMKLKWIATALHMGDMDPWLQPAEGINVKSED